MIGQIVFDDVEDTGTLANSIYQIESQIHQIADEAYLLLKQEVEDINVLK